MVEILSRDVVERKIAECTKRIKELEHKFKTGHCRGREKYVKKAKLIKEEKQMWIDMLKSFQ